MSELVFDSVPVSYPYSRMSTYDVLVARTPSGAEHRRALSYLPVRRLKVMYMPKNESQMQDLWDFYNARKGQHESWLFPFEDRIIDEAIGAKVAGVTYSSLYPPTGYPELRDDGDLYYYPPNPFPLASDVATGYFLNDNAANTNVAPAYAGNVGTMMTGNTNAFTATGKYNSAFTFNGSNYINCGNNFCPSGNNSRSIEAWCYITNNANARPIAGWGTDAQPRRTFNIGAYNQGDGFKWWLWTNTTDYKFGLATTNVWHHVVATYNSTSRLMVYYVDGVENGRVTFANDLYVTDRTLFIGRMSYTDSFRFVGRIDCVRVYNKDLLASQVAALYSNATEAIPGPPSPVLVRAAGTLVEGVDYSVNKNTGVVTFIRDVISGFMDYTPCVEVRFDCTLTRERVFNAQFKPIEVDIVEVR